MNIRSERRKKYRLDELTVGTSITLPAEMLEDFQHARVTVSEFNRKRGTVIKTKVQADGSMLITRLADPENPDVGVVVMHPTKDEWDAYIRSMESGQSFSMYGNHVKRFAEFIYWCKLLTASEIAVKAEEEPEGTLTITRL